MGGLLSEANFYLKYIVSYEVCQVVVKKEGGEMLVLTAPCRIGCGLVVASSATVLLRQVQRDFRYQPGEEDERVGDGEAYPSRLRF